MALDLDFDKLKVLYPDKTTLLVKKTMWGQLVLLLTAPVGLLFLYFVSTQATMGATEKLFFIVIAGGILISAIKPLKIIIFQEQFSFNNTTQNVFRNKEQKAHFNEIDNVEIISCDGDSPSYLLNLRLMDRSSIQIADATDRKEVFRIAGEIASFTNKKLVKK
jgi:hypothetical protein